MAGASRRSVPNEENMSPCINCPVRETCTEPCPDLEALLPSPDQGAEPYRSREKAEALSAERDAVASMLEHRRSLEGRHRRVFNLTYNAGLPQREIARRMGVHQRSVSRLLDQARRKLRNRIWRKRLRTRL